MKTRPVTNLFRLLLSLSLYIFISLSLAAPAQAAGTSQCDPARGMTFACLGEAVNENIFHNPQLRTNENLGRNTADLTIGLLTTFNTLIGGVQVGEALGAQTGAFNFPPNPYIEGGGAFGMLASAVGVVFDNPPMNLVDERQFFAEALGNNLLHPSTALAAVSVRPGATVLINSGFAPLWRFFRNAAYLGLALVLVIFGLMVMLRAKADPRTTVTFQMALPRIAVALVLIYFSFTIAGLLLDVGNVGIKLVEGVFCTGSGCPINQAAKTANIGDMLKDFVTKLGEVDFGIQTGEGAIDTLLKFIVLLFALQTVLRLFWVMIERYVILFLQAVMGPISFLFGVLPGREEMPSRWARQLLVSVLTFPGIYFIVNLAYFVLNPATAIGLPPVAEATGDFATKISGLLAIGILSRASSVPAILEEIFDVVPGAHAARAGADPGSLLKNLPVVGKLTG